MKTKQSLVCGFLAVIFALVFTACSGKSSGKGGNSDRSINSATELKEYLDQQPANGPDEPIKVVMKANDMMIEGIARVIGNAGKYVSLDLSGSPLTEIPREAFSDCKSLTNITLPNSVTAIGDYAFDQCYEHNAPQQFNVYRQICVYRVPTSYQYHHPRQRNVYRPRPVQRLDCLADHQHTG